MLGVDSSSYALLKERENPADGRLLRGSDLTRVFWRVLVGWEASIVGMILHCGWFPQTDVRESCASVGVGILFARVVRRG